MLFTLYLLTQPLNLPIQPIPYRAEPEVIERPHMEQLIYNVARSEGVSEEDAERLIEVAKCESRLDPNAKNPNSSAKGLLQIMGSVWEPRFGLDSTQLYDPVINVQAASDILKIQGWGAWKECL
jgi:hypothetical protein